METRFLEEKSKNLSSQVLPSGLLVVHDSSRGGHDDVTEMKTNKISYVFTCDF